MDRFKLKFIVAQNWLVERFVKLHNDKPLSNLRLDRVKGKANPQLARAKMIVNVFQKTLTHTTENTSRYREA